MPIWKDYSISSDRPEKSGAHMHLIKTDLQVKISYDMECRPFSMEW